MCKPAQRQATLFCCVHRNTFPMVWSQADHLVCGMKWNIQCAADSHRQRSSLVPKLWDRKHLVSLGWPLSMSAGCRGFKVDLQVPSKKRQLWMWQEVLLSGTWLPPRKSDEIKGIENISDRLHPYRDAASSAYSVLAWLEIALDCFYTQYWKSGFNLMLNIVPIKNTFAAPWYCCTHFYWSFMVLMRLSDEKLIKRWKCGTHLNWHGWWLIPDLSVCSKHKQAFPKNYIFPFLSFWPPPPSPPSLNLSWDYASCLLEAQTALNLLTYT